MPCADCGESVDRLSAVPHRCQPRRDLDAGLDAPPEDVGRFETQLHAYLDSPRGRFEAWLAARAVRGEQAR